MDGLLTIGDFSRMTFLTVKALRHYHDVGLLEPARTDPSSGYRYYRAEQVAEARLIRRLRDLDLPVDDVRTVLTAPDEATRNAVMVEHLDRMSRQLEEVQDTVDSLRRMLSGDDEEIGISYRDEPATMVLAIRGHVDGRRCRLLVDGGVHRAASTAQDRRDRRAPDPTGRSSRPSSSPRVPRELVAFVPVERVPALPGRVEAVVRPAARYAVALHDGADGRPGRRLLGRRPAGPRASARRGRPVGREIPPAR